MKDPFFRLTSVLSRLRRDQRDSLADLPDRISAVLEIYTRLETNDAKRQDMYNLINGSLSLAEAMATDTYPAPTGVRWATHLINVLCRVIDHLENRPSVQRFGLLCVDTGELHSETYSSPHDAGEALQTLRRFGATRQFEVVPVSVTSGHVVQPPPAPDLLSPETSQMDPSHDLSMDPGENSEVASDGGAPAFDPEVPPIPQGVKPV